MALTEGHANAIAQWLAGQPGGSRVLAEVVERRARTAKTFRNADGTCTAVIHAKPIHYREAPGGPWLEIDNTWERSSRPGFAWEMTRCGYQAWIAEDLRADPFLRVAPRGEGKTIEYRLGEVQWRSADRAERVADVPNRRIARASGNALEVADFCASGVTLRIIADTHRLRIRAEVPEAASEHLPACGLKFDVGDEPVLTVQFVRTGLHLLASGDPIYGETSDGCIYGEDATYATARSTSSASTVAVTSVRAGQLHNGTVYQVFRAYFDFDTSPIPDGATVLSATLYVCAKADGSSTDFEVKVYRYAWSEPLADSREANYDGAYGGSATAEGTIRNTADGWVADTYYDLAVATGGINRTGDTKYTLVSKEDVDNSAPANSDSEYVDAYSADEAGTTKDPKLVVTWSPDATVEPPAATATAEAPVPTVAVGVTLEPAVATATAEAPIPALALGVTLEPPAATATAEAIAPAKAYGTSAVNEFALGSSGSEQRMAHGDCVMTVQHPQIVRETRTAAGSLVRDTITTKRVFSFDYSWIPGKQHNVPDAGMGRDDLLALFEAGGEYSFHLPTEDALPEDVTVMFDAQSWNETLVQRDGPFGWVWALAFRLVEV